MNFGEHSMCNAHDHVVLHPAEVGASNQTLGFAVVRLELTDKLCQPSFELL